MRKIKMLVYGLPGVGKTRFLGTAADSLLTSPTLMLDFEAGTWSISSKVIEITLEQLLDGFVPKEQSKVYVVRIKGWTDFDKVLDFLYTNEKTMLWKSILVDSISEINYLNLRDAVKTDPKPSSPDPAMDKYLKGVAQLKHYLKSQTQMRRMIRDFRDLDIHVFFSAQSGEDKDEMTGETYIRPGMVGKLAGEIPGLVDIVGYMYTNSAGNRIMRFQPTHRILAKDRAEESELGDEQDNMTISDLLKLTGLEVTP